MQVIINVSRRLFHRIFQQGRGHGKRSIVEIGPAKSVGGIWQVGQPTTRSLRQRKGYRYSAAVFEHKVSKIIGGQSLVGLDRQWLLIGRFRLLPISLPFIQSAQRDIDAGGIRRQLNSALIIGDGLRHFSARRLELSQKQQSIHILFVDFKRARKRALRFLWLLVLQQDLALNEIKSRAIGIALQLRLNKLQSLARVIAVQSQFDQTLHGIKGIWIFVQSLTIELFSFIPSFLYCAQIAQLYVTDRALRIQLD